jgi:hypothetical protein
MVAKPFSQVLQLEPEAHTPVTSLLFPDVRVCNVMAGKCHPDALRARNPSRVTLKFDQWQMTSITTGGRGLNECKNFPGVLNRVKILKPRWTDDPHLCGACFGPVSLLVVDEDSCGVRLRV